MQLLIFRTEKARKSGAQGTLDAYKPRGRSNIIDSDSDRSAPVDAASAAEPARRSVRDRVLIDYKALESGVRNPDDLRKDKWTRRIREREIRGLFVSGVDTGAVKLCRGAELTMDWVRRHGWTDPLLILRQEGLDMEMPASLTVDEVAAQVDPHRKIEAINVPTQTESQFTLQEWADYYNEQSNHTNTTNTINNNNNIDDVNNNNINNNSTVQQRDNVYNVISLEISHTKLAARIRRPRIVRELDWVDTIWPADRKKPHNGLHNWPKVQLYCLMSVKNSYTDFHIDFGGSSVFYHIIHGSKVFYFIPPTPLNLQRYEAWATSEQQHDVFFGDVVDVCYEVKLEAGNTLMIPSGWIHAVYTPHNSVVIGGNFLTSFTIPMQLRIFELETRTFVTPKFRYSQFEHLNWLAAVHYHDVLYQTPDTLTLRELDGLYQLGQYLCARIGYLLVNASTLQRISQKSYNGHNIHQDKNESEMNASMPTSTSIPMPTTRIKTENDDSDTKALRDELAYIADSVPAQFRTQVDDTHNGDDGRYRKAVALATGLMARAVAVRQVWDMYLLKHVINGPVLLAPPLPTPNQPISSLPMHSLPETQSSILNPPMMQSVQSPNDMSRVDINTMKMVREAKHLENERMMAAGELTEAETDTETEPDTAY